MFRSHSILLMILVVLLMACVVTPTPTISPVSTPTTLPKTPTTSPLLTPTIMPLLPTPTPEDSPLPTPVSPLPTATVVLVRPSPPVRSLAVLPEDAPMSDCPVGFKPEHVWYSIYVAKWEGDRYWEGETCLLKCVSFECDKVSGLGREHPCTDVYLNSFGEDRPPWCVIGN